MGAGFAQGVLFTEAVAGTPLDEALLADPARAGDLRVVVALLRRLPRPPVAGSTVAFGDLKPEHILLGVDGQPTYLDPGALASSASTDAARLVCRLLLWLWSRLPTPEVRAAITDGLEAFVADWIAARAVGNPSELVSLILLDAINILSTYISAGSSRLSSGRPSPCRAPVTGRRRGGG